MDNQKKITLAIFGNQNSNSGFQPLFWINNPPQQLENLVPPGMEENAYFFVLETGTTYSQYTLIQNHVSSYMSSRAGVLKMAITLPQGWRIANGESPLNVLLRIRRKFLETCMTQKSALTETYNFNEKLVSPEVFSEILDEYTLVPGPSMQRVMVGTDDALLLLNDEQQIADLFKDIQYPEFTVYKRVIVATKGNTSTYQHLINGLQIPRRPQLQLVVNGHTMNWPVANYYQEPVTIDLKRNRRCWDYEVVSFTVNDIIDKPVNDPLHGINLHINWQTEQVICNITPQPKRLNIKVHVQGCSDEATFCRWLTILIGPKRQVKKLAADGSFDLTGDEIMYFYTRELLPDYNGADYTISSSSFEGETLHIVAKEKPVAPKKTPASMTGTATQIRIKSQETSINVTPQQEPQPSPSPIKKYGLWLILLLIIGLLAWLLISQLSSSHSRKNDDTSINADSDIDDVDQEEEGDDDVNNDETFDLERMLGYQKALKDADLTFTDIDKMAQWVADEPIAQACNDNNPEFVNTVKTYKSVVDAIRNGDATSVKKEEENLNDIHLWQVRNIYYGWADDNYQYPYTGPSRQAVSQEFEKIHKNFTSFKDLEQLHYDKARHDVRLHLQKLPRNQATQEVVRSTPTRERQRQSSGGGQQKPKKEGQPLPPEE